MDDFPPLQCMVSAKIHKNSFDVSCLPHPTVWDKRAEKIAEGKLWISVVQDPIMENHHQCTYHSITFFNLSRSWFGTVELCVVLLESGSMWNSALNPPRFQSGKSMVREAIIENFVTRFPSDFSFFRLFEGAPLSDGHVEVIKCPEYRCDPSLKVSATESKSTCFNFANVANPLVSTLGSDFLS